MNRLSRALHREAAARRYPQEVREHRLHWLEIEITRRCPLACLHCGSSCSGEQYYKEELSAVEILAFLKRMDEAYGAANLMVCFTGGEPLVRDDLYTLMAHATEMGYRATLVTNGMLVDGRAVDLLAAAGLSTITVSLDGLAATHNRARGNPQSFDRAVGALRLLKESGYFHVVEALTCVSKQTLAELPALRELLHSLAIDHWRLTRIFPIGRAREYPELLLDNRELLQLLDWIKTARKVEPAFLSYGEEGCLGKEYDFQVRDEPQHCDAGVHILTLLADGGLTGCAACDHGFIQGNIKTDDPAGLWERAFQPFRDRSWMREGICGKCDEFRHCHGDGMHLWQPGKKHPADCLHLRLLNKGL
jgi:radical SAM protein with 4Fe4S-binding SPASM domain